jgi:hypothetical protein
MLLKISVFMLLAVKVNREMFPTFKHLTVKMSRQHGIWSTGEFISHVLLCFIQGTNLVVFVHYIQTQS